MDIPPLSSAPLQISASALIATLHQTFTNTQYRALRIDSTSVIYLGPNIEESFIQAAWEHAYRRAEDQALLVMPTHSAATTAFFSAVQNFPNANPAIGQALNVLTPFFTALTKSNISTRFHNGLSVLYSLNSDGAIISSRIKISKQPFTSLNQLTHLPTGDRVFDVFYHLLLAEAERAQHLSLKKPEEYELLRNGTFSLPEWVTFSDDYALAKDWSDGLRQCGIKGAALRGVLSTLSGILLLGNRSSREDQQEGCALLGLDPACLNRYSADELISSAYTELVLNVVSELNHYLASHDAFFEPSPDTEDDPNDEIAVVAIVECAASSKNAILRNVFDNSAGINREMSEDGLVLSKTSAAITRTLAKNDQLGVAVVPSIENFRSSFDPEISYLARVPYPIVHDDVDSEYLQVDSLPDTSRIWNILSVAPCADAEGQAKDVWSSQLVSSQIREYFITEWAVKRRNINFTVDIVLEEFIERYGSVLPPNVGFYELEGWARDQRGWGPNDFYTGSRVWIGEEIWRELEMAVGGLVEQPLVDPFANAAPSMLPHLAPSIVAPSGVAVPVPDTTGESIQYGSREYENPFEAQSARLLPDSYGQEGTKEYAGSLRSLDSDEEEDERIPIDEDYLKKYHGDLENNNGHGNNVEVVTMDGERRAWVWFVWMLTWWIPSPFLKYLMRMKRSEVRMAWREKLVICFLIFLLNAAIIFYMIFLGKFICPDFDKVWNAKQVATHQGTNDFYVSIHGNVYDITNFYRQQHSDNGIQTNANVMLPFAGQDCSDYFPPPLTVACPNLVKDKTVQLSYNSTLSPNSIGLHVSGSNSQYVASALHKETWYNDVFTPSIMNYYKGRVVATTGDVKEQALNNPNLMWAIINNEIYDISNYMLTVQNRDPTHYPQYNFFDSRVVDLFQNNQGLDITSEFNGPTIDPTTRANTLQCLKNAFHYGTVDFRQSAKCQAANYILLVMAGILTSVTVIKFLASLKFGGKKMPSPQDKFVVCQIPCYTESEDALRLAVDSLTSMSYDNSRKLLFLICDGMIVGAGNDRPTPRIVLDLLGVDEKVDPPAKAYQAVGEGANKLNYAKVYSGLYEFEGNVVPFIVVVKVGRPNETRRPGNRGKRDSQIILMSLFNRVHYQTPMSPLELELFHQLNNVVGVDPELYEYVLMVDADTSVAEDSLTRLVAHCSNDAKVAGTCGETALQNEEQSWTTMVQVYEYFISHHLTKAFESLFGSVTCLPGCFSLYRMRTPKKCKPLIISSDIIRDYSVGNVDTLHKKNLFSLGEDRYLTTLITKNFPKMRLTFVAEAMAYTQAPDEFKVLLSQRRRWINSTVHNLVELLRLNNMCGFLFFGMRGVVFIDLVGTMMLPSVVVYLGYLIYRIASHSGPLPIISIVLIGAVYGIQALVFILRRQWQHIGWMIIYLAAYPIHSFLLPIYSFWNQDNFTWGNTRIVVGEKGGKQLVSIDDEGFDPKSIEMETWRSYAIRNGFKGAERPIIFDERKGRLQNQVYEDEYGYDMQELAPVDKRKTIFDADQLSRMDGPGGASIYNRPISTFSEINRGDSPYKSELPASQSRMSLAAASRMSMADAPAASLYDEERMVTIGDTIRQVLASADLDNMTKRQLREQVEETLNVRFTGDRVAMVDSLIDEELEKLDEEDDHDSVDDLKSI